jgi:hypothetical protein
MTGAREGVSPLSLRSRPAGLLALLSVAGCGGGLPLLHPAQTLGAGEVRAMGGLSSNVAVGGLSAATRNAVNEAAGNPNAPSPGDVTYAEGALVAAAIAPGLAPIVGARVGLGEEAEGGLAYTGRSVRIDVRRAFELSPTLAISVGVGGSAALYGSEATGSLPNVDVNHLHGWGADVPVLFGYRSDGDLYMLWVGVRGGWEHDNIDDLSSEPGTAPLGTPPISLSATRFWGGALAGAAVGFRHVHIAMELDASYSNVTGVYNQTHATVVGVSLAPAAALWWKF